MRQYLATVACGLLLSLWSGVASSEVVVAVAQDSPVEALSPADLRDVYLGRIHRLSNGTPVVPLDQSEGNPAYAAFYRKYLGRSTAEIKSHWSKRIFTGRGQPPRRVADDEAMARALADNPSAIGYLDRDSLDDRLRVVAIE